MSLISLCQRTIECNNDNRCLAWLTCSVAETNDKVAFSQSWQIKSSNAAETENINVWRRDEATMQDTHLRIIMSNLLFCLENKISCSCALLFVSSILEEREQTEISPSFCALGQSCLTSVSFVWPVQLRKSAEEISDSALCPCHRRGRGSCVIVRYCWGQQSVNNRWLS